MQPRTSKPIDKAWAEAFSQAIINRKEPQGDGWKTFPQLHKEMGMGLNRTHSSICYLLKKGILERFNGYKHNGKRFVREVWYRPVALKGRTRADTAYVPAKASKRL